MYKNVLFLLIFFFSIGFAEAQQSTEQLIDRLNKTTDTKERVSLLNRLAWNKSKQDTAKAMRYAKDALKLAKDNNDEYGMGAAYFNIGRIFYFRSIYDASINNYSEALKYREKTNDIEGLVKIYNSIALCYIDQLDYQRAISYYLKILERLEESDNKELEARTRTNIADLNIKQGNLDKAVPELKKAIALALEAKSDKDIAYAKFTVGRVYMERAKYDEAIKEFIDSQELYEKLNDKKEIAQSYRFIGRAYFLKKDYGEALQNYVMSQMLLKEEKIYFGLPYAYSDIGELYYKLGDYEEAEKYFKEAIRTLQKVSNPELETLVYKQISDNYASRKMYGEAYFYHLKFKRLNDQLNNRNSMRKIANLEMNFRLEEQEKDQQEEMRQQKIFTGIFIFGFIFMVAFAIVVFRSYKTKQRDNKLLAVQKEELLQQKEEILTTSEQLAETNSELEKLSIVASKTDNAVHISDKDGNYIWVNDGYERVYGYNHEQLINEIGTNLINSKKTEEALNQIKYCLKSKKPVVYEQETKSRAGKHLWVQTTLTPIVDGDNNITTLIGIDSDITKIKEVEHEIMVQRDRLKKQNQRINSSIRYAKTIQNAILPMKDDINKYFESFILFKPKDIVSGDFYWKSVIKKNNVTKIYIAVVDCTGHGVPGAFMSMIGSRLLNEIVNEKHIESPAEILDELNKGIHVSLQQEQTDNNDGMDVCLCLIEKEEENKQYKIIYSGAERPLMYYKKGEGIGKLDGDPKSIGGILSIRDTTPFSNRTILLNKGDSIYLTSDGLIDQNNSGKIRFGTPQLVSLVEQNSAETMKTVHAKIEEALKKHQGEEEQRDDITVIGLRMK